MAEKLLMTHCSSFLLPPTFTDAENSSLPATYALIILNQRLPRFSPLLWEHAKIRLCADGGANRLFDNMPELYPQEHNVSVIHERYKPDVIKGDMDSIRPDVLSFYRSLVFLKPGFPWKQPLYPLGVEGTKIVDNSDDQDTTDLHKCITYVRDFVSDDDKSNLCILVAGALGGRFDHEMGNVNTLCHFSMTRIVLLSDDCLIQLLPGSRRHEIHIQSSVEGPHCGLIPIGTPSGSSTTTGLQWDLDNTEMRFGGLVSTSNIVKGEMVTVRSDSDLLWTISLKKQP